MDLELGIILLFLVIVAVYLRTVLFPDRIGTVVKITCVTAEGTACSATCARDAVKGMPATALVDIGGETIEAECSGCSLCMGDICPGAHVGVSRIGSRLIAQPLLFPTLQARWGG